MLSQIKSTLLIISLPLLLSCNSEGSEEVTESDTAYTDYENFVTQFEEDTLTEVELQAMQQAENDSTSWAEMKAARQQQFEQRRQAVDQNLNEYDEERRNEIQDLGKRYDLANQKQEQKFQEASRRYKLREQLLGIAIRKDDLSDVTPENMASTYQQFVNTVAENGARYEARDWNLIEGWWSSLNSRYRNIENDLSQQTRQDIQQAQSRYKEVRQQYVSL